MKFNDNPFMILLGIIMIGLGIGSFLGYHVPTNNQILLIAYFVLAALLILLVLAGKIKEAVGSVIAAFWLIMIGLTGWFHMDFTYRSLIESLLPLAAGAFMFLGM